MAPQRRVTGVGLELSTSVGQMPVTVEHARCAVATPPASVTEPLASPVITASVVATGDGDGDQLGGAVDRGDA